jgi:hypothetical protein
VEDSFTHLEPLKEGDQVRALLGETADGKRRPHTHGCEVIRVEETGEVTMRVPTQVDPEDGDDIAAGVDGTNSRFVARMRTYFLKHMVDSSSCRGAYGVRVIMRMRSTQRCLPKKNLQGFWGSPSVTAFGLIQWICCPISWFGLKTKTLTFSLL